MKKKEVNINEESTSAGGAHAVNKFRISDFVMMAVIVILCARVTSPMRFPENWCCASAEHWRRREKPRSFRSRCP